MDMKHTQNGTECNKSSDDVNFLLEIILLTGFEATIQELHVLLVVFLANAF